MIDYETAILFIEAVTMGWEKEIKEFDKYLKLCWEDHPEELKNE